MPSEGFEPAIPAGERLQTHALRLLGHWNRRTIAISSQNYQVYVTVAVVVEEEVVVVIMIINHE